MRTCVLRVTTKKVVNILHPWICPLEEILWVPLAAADGTAPKIPPLRLWRRPNNSPLRYLPNSYLWRPIASQWLKIDLLCLHDIVLHFWPKLTHAAVARSLCDSWASCLDFSSSSISVCFSFFGRKQEYCFYAELYSIYLHVSLSLSPTFWLTFLRESLLRQPYTGKNVFHDRITVSEQPELPSGEWKESR